VIALTAATRLGHPAAAHPAPWLHVDAGAEAAFAGLDVAILAALLVVASLLQLGSPQDGTRFSIEAAQAWGHSVTLLRLVEMLVYLSAAGAVLSLVAMAVTTAVIGWIALAATLLTIFSFAVVCVLSIRWFWKRSRDEQKE
jgi:hypothetical protein